MLGCPGLSRRSKPECASGLATYEHHNTQDVHPDNAPNLARHLAAVPSSATAKTSRLLLEEWPINHLLMASWLCPESARVAHVVGSNEVWRMTCSKLKRAKLACFPVRLKPCRALWLEPIAGSACVFRNVVRRSFSDPCPSSDARCCGFLVQ